mgnify:CR=1 FL=1
MKQLMMIGFGAMANDVCSHLPKDLELKWVVVPERSVDAVKQKVAADVHVISKIDDCLGEPDYVIEVAGQAAVKEHALDVLKRGWTIGLISVGTLADPAFFEKLQKTGQFLVTKWRLFKLLGNKKILLNINCIEFGYLF